MRLESNVPGRTTSAAIHNRLTVLAWLLVMATLLRIGAVIFASPMVGYADNWDFTRVSSCTGVWQTDGVAVPQVPDSLHPVNALLYSGATSRTTCLRGAENLFPMVATLWHQKGDFIDFREISGLKFLLLAVAATWMIGSLARGAQKLAVAAALWLSIGDSAILPYFNSFYVDGSALIGVFVAIAWSVWVMTADDAPTKGSIYAGLAIMAWIAASKQQYMPFALALAVLTTMAVWIRWKNRPFVTRFLLPALVVSILISSFLNYRSPMMIGIGKANSSNTFLGAVLPAATDPVAALETMGLPPICQKVIGQGWFTPGFQTENPCPEIYKASRISLLPLFFSQPSTFYVPLLNGVTSSWPLYPDSLGVIEKPGNENQPWIQWVRLTSLSPWLARMSLPVYSATIWAFIGLGITGLIASFYLLVTLAKKERHDALAACLMIGIGGACVLYTIASSIFGDGYSDFKKHAAGAVVGLGYQVAGLILFVLQWFLQKFKTSSHEIDALKATKITFDPANQR